jgi:hypothetical protein
VEGWNEGRVEKWNGGRMRMRDGWNERRMEYKKDIRAFKHAIRCSFFASCKLVIGKKSCHSAKGILLGLSLTQNL